MFRPPRTRRLRPSVEGVAALTRSARIDAKFMAAHLLPSGVKKFKWRFLSQRQMASGRDREQCSETEREKDMYIERGRGRESDVSALEISNLVSMQYAKKALVKVQVF